MAMIQSSNTLAGSAAIDPVPPAVVAAGNAGRSLEDALERALDVFFALSLFTIFSPVFVTATAMIGLSGGPVFFTQSRLGQGNKPFAVYKFRTMVPNAADALAKILEADEDRRQEWAREAKLKNDPRITPIGRFLRKSSLDELPQLLNILRGDMSLVGPRPIVPEEIRNYGRYAKYYFAQRPGLTGLWQVSGRNNVSYRRRVALDVYYSRHRNLPLNLAIILRTIRIVAAGSGAY